MTSSTMAELSPSWDRGFRYLPLLLLGVGLVIGFGTQHLLAPEPWRYAALAAIGVAVAAWHCWWTFAPAHRDDLPTDRALYYWVRSAAAFAMTWINPFLAFFAFVGYTDAFDIFRPRVVYLAVGVTAVTMAGSQAGGLPLADAGQWAIFVVLVAVNAALAGAFSHFHGAVVAMSDERGEQLSEQARLNAELSEALRRNEELSDQVVAVARDAGAQAERQRLAREIHDTVAQGLAGVLAQLRAAQDDVDPAAARGHVARAERLARESLAEARRSVQALAPAPLEDRSLAEALDVLVSAWTASHGVTARLVVSGAACALHPEVEATVVRVAQEALANVARHAAATRVGVTLTYTDTDVLLDVRDDGVGFEVDAERPASSFGLRGMRQRAQRVAGTLDLESEPGGGTAVGLQVPAVRAAEPVPQEVVP